MAIIPDISEPIRVNELARLLERPGDSILAYAQQRGFKVLNQLGILSVREAQQIVEDVRDEHQEVRRGNVLLRRRRFDEDGNLVPMPEPKAPEAPKPLPSPDPASPKKKPRKKLGRKPKPVEPKPAVRETTKPPLSLEPEGSEPMPTKLVELTADLVASQASTTSMSTDEIGAALVQVYNILFVINQAEEADKPCGEIICTCEDEAPEEDTTKTSPKTAAPAIDPSASIQADKVICLECGESFTMLNSKHLKSHGLTSRTYKQKHGMKLGTKLMAGEALKKRSKAAKERGTGKGLAAWRATRKAAKKG